MKEDGDGLSLKSVHLFVDAWMKHDRNAANCIPISRFVTMMQDAPWPFGLQRPDGSPMPNNEIVRRLKQVRWVPGAQSGTVVPVMRDPCILCRPFLSTAQVAVWVVAAPPIHFQALFLAPQSC